MIKVNTIRNRKTSKDVSEAYNKMSAAKQVEELKENNSVEESVDEVESNDTITQTEEIDLGSLTKAELLEYALEKLDLELDKTKKKSELIEEIESSLK